MQRREAPAESLQGFGCMLEQQTNVTQRALTRIYSQMKEAFAMSICADTTTDKKPNLHIYHTPGACSRGILNAIEEIGEPYQETCLALARGDQRKPEYLAINPKGKVPALVENDVVITESPAILYHLAQTRPAARLLPADATGAPTLQSLSDMIWIAGALHPAMNRIFMPGSTSQADPDGVRANATRQLRDYAQAISARYGQSAWYYRDAWSIVDFYVAWVFSLANQYGFELDDYTEIVDLIARCEARPSFQRARAVERAAAAREKMPMPPGFKI